MIRGIKGVESPDGLPAPWQLPRDVEELEQAIVGMAVKCVIIDPMSAAMGRECDPYKDTDVRRALGPLTAAAQRTGAAVILIRHLNKGTGKAMYRGGGSIGIIGAVRSALLVARDPEDDMGCVLALYKHNLGPGVSSYKFRLEGAPGIGCARIEWGDASDLTADSLVADQGDLKRSETELMAELLWQATGAGRIEVDEARRQLRAAGFEFDDRKLARARDKAGLGSSPPEGFGGTRYFYRPDKRTPESPDNVPEPFSNVSTDRTVANRGLLLPTASHDTSANASGLIIGQRMTVDHGTGHVE